MRGWWGIEERREYQLAGKRWVVDIDLAKFFDEVNHDLLMARIAKKAGDKKVLRLIRRYLQAGIMKDGVLWDRDKGTPQGGPLSPPLSNIMLDAMDNEPEKRGLSFCRYADDCKVNREKSAVARPWERKAATSPVHHRNPKPSHSRLDSVLLPCGDGSSFRLQPERLVVELRRTAHELRVPQENTLTAWYSFR
ncbi:MAG TPA: reverse transcriptase domain-containing protein [Rectinemataceae bacterium]|nr:reverse transcriptase domain-containing protein [Rectinemataceae bacterium]